MKKLFILMSLLICMLLVACSDDEVSPNDRFDTYVKNWQDNDFSKMYDMLEDKSKSTYSTEEYVDRYKKIYQDLGVSDLKITYKKLNEEKVTAALEKGKATYPFTVEMNTIAGQIKFDYKAKLIQQGEDDNKNWYVKWDPGFIFPAMKDGGEISFVTEKARRGEILDRNRSPLAINDTVWEIGIIPKKLGDSPEAKKKEIADLLGMDVATINNKLEANWVKPNLLVPIKKVPTTYDKLEALWATGAVKGDKVTGRVYPYGESAAHLVGYIGKITAEELEKQETGTYSANDLIGKRGLEKLYDTKLRGQEGIKIIITQEGQNDTILAEKPVKDGENITLTINAETQKAIYQTYDGDAGTTAAINPKTGETLALVSSPAFDPNEFVHGISQSKFKEMQDNPKQPLINKFSATFVPGSVIKPLTTTIGIQNGTLDPDKGIEINGLTWSPGEGFGDYKVRRVSESDGPVDLEDALVRSDNIYFAMQTLDMGSEAFVNGMKKFGFGVEIPFAYPLQTSTVSNNGKINDKVLLANSGYGQGQMQVNPLHLATTFSPFLNKGNMVKPILFKEEKPGQIWKKDVVTDDQAKLIRDDLRKVVTSPKGTANPAQKADIPLSVKTGTAELKKSLDEKGAQVNGWAVGYPTESQDIIIAMMIEHIEKKEPHSYKVDKLTEIFNKIK